MRRFRSVSRSEQAREEVRMHSHDAPEDPVLSQETIQTLARLQGVAERLERAVVRLESMTGEE